MEIKKRIFLLVLGVLVIILAAVIVYLSRVVLPTQIKSLVIQSLQEQTHKNVSLVSLRFNLFKGLVLRDLALYDGEIEIAHLKESSCTFLLLPLLKEKLIIRNLNLKSPSVFLERKADNTLNLQELFLPPAGSKGAKAGWKVVVLRVNIRDATIHFQDNTTKPAFSKDILHLDVTAELTLPSSVKFGLTAQVPTSTDKPMHLEAGGEFKIPEQTLVSRIKFQDFSPKEFINYYQDLGVNIPEGKVSGLIDLEYKLKEDALYADLEAKGEDLLIAKENISARVSSDIRMSLLYNLQEKQMAYSGKAKILDGFLQGLQVFDSVDRISGDVEFSTQGSGCDFKLTLSSDTLLLESVFNYDQKLVSLSQCVGRYLQSSFSMTGLIDTKDSVNGQTDIKGNLDINLEDLRAWLKKFENQLEKVRPQGSLKGSFSLQGPIRDIKSCTIKADFSSPALSAYGLKAHELQGTYIQEKGLGLLPLLRLSFYDGMVEANGTVNYREQDYPYGLNVNIQGIKLEQLKQDTAARDKDIAGDVNAEVKLYGVCRDLSRGNGEGKILFTDGKLWQLNLFQGLGALLFAKKDFSTIVFDQGTCDFVVRDKFLMTDNLLLKSQITDLSGSVKIGFDNSIDVSLNVHVLDDKVPLTGTFKDITTSIVGEGGLFGVIKINGTLKEPKYRFQTAVLNILKGLTDKILGR